MDTVGRHTEHITEINRTLYIASDIQDTTDTKASSVHSGYKRYIHRTHQQNSRGLTQQTQRGYIRTEDTTDTQNTAKQWTKQTQRGYIRTEDTTDTQNTAKQWTQQTQRDTQNTAKQWTQQTQIIHQNSTSVIVEVVDHTSCTFH